MKTAVVFLLVAVTASYGYVQQHQQPQQPSCGGHGSNPGYGQIPNTNCLQNVLKNDLKFILEALKDLICSYENCKKNLGCTVDEVLFHGEPTVEQIAEEVGKLLEQLRDPIRCLLIDVLKIEEPVFKLLCSVLGEALVKVADVLGNLDTMLNLATSATGGLGGVGGFL